MKAAFTVKRVLIIALCLVATITMFCITPYAAEPAAAPQAAEKVKLTFLVDNNTKVGYYFLGESAFSMLIQDGDNKILFDAGYSDAFLRNAQQMKLNLLDLDSIVLSHGHLDHVWGLHPLTKHYTEAKLQKMECTKPTVVAHPSVFKSRKIPGELEIGAMFSKEYLSRFFNVNLSKEPVWLSDKWVFLGEIDRIFSFEGKSPGGVDENGNPDYVEDDSALVYKSPEGLVIITGCAHSGICNTIEYAKKVCKDNRIVDVIGGFHLNNPSEVQLKGTLSYFKHAKIPALHACHCVDLKSKIALAKVANLQEVWVGQTLEY